MIATGPSIEKAKHEPRSGTPIDLQLAVIQASEWVKHGVIRRNVFLQIVRAVEEELRSIGLSIAEPV